MELNSDLTELLKSLNAARVRYIVVGAHAVVHYTEPRYTKDLDLWVEPSAENARRVYGVLAAFGAPLQGISESDFANPDLVYQVGIEPNRVDFMMGLEAVRFETAWRNKVATALGSVRINILSRQDLIRNKRATGRPQDMLDVHRLTAAHRSFKRPSPRRRQTRRRK